MDRFIIRYKGNGPKPEEDVQRIRALPTATIIDDSPRMLLVAAPETELRSLIDSMSDWIVAPERTLKTPDPRPKPARDPNE